MRASQLLLLAFTLLVATTGCHLISPPSDAKFQEITGGQGSTYTVLLKGSKPEARAIQQGMTVQDVLEQSGATKRWKRLRVLVKRVIPGKQMRHRLEVDYDVNERRVPFEQDYAILPNDIILVAPDQTSQFAKTVDKLSGVFGGAQ